MNNHSHDIEGGNPTGYDQSTIDVDHDSQRDMGAHSASNLNWQPIGSQDILPPTTPSRSNASTPTSMISVTQQHSPSTAPTKCGTIDLLSALSPEIMQQFSYVLVVDDSQINRKMICRSLQSLGFVCTQASDGIECVEMVSNALKSGSNHGENRIDLILMDYEMPRLNGPLATEKLRKMRIKIPVIGITGNVLKEDSEYFIEKGANQVIHKPFTVQMLEKALVEIVRHNTNSS